MGFERIWFKRVLHPQREPVCRLLLCTQTPGNADRNGGKKRFARMTPIWRFSNYGRKGKLKLPLYRSECWRITADLVSFTDQLSLPCFDLINSPVRAAQGRKSLGHGLSHSTCKNCSTDMVSRGSKEKGASMNNR